MKKKGLIILFLFAITAAMAQEQLSIAEMAERYYAQFDYALAAPIYEKMLRKQKEPNPDWMYKAAYSYESMQDYEKAVGWYKKLVSNGKSVELDMYLHTGDLLKILEQYDSAYIFYKRYTDLGGQAEIGASRMQSCTDAPKWKANPTTHAIANEERLNSDLSEWGTNFYKGEVIFTSESARTYMGKKLKKSKATYNWTDNPFLKLYITNDYRQGEKIVSFLDDVNKYDYHVGPAVFSKNYDTVYITRTYLKANSQYTKVNRKLNIGTRRLEILYAVKKRNNLWSTPIPLTFGTKTEYSLGHATLNANGSVLYFTSDMPGGFGKTDIWYSEKTIDNKWGKPVNCGSVINTMDEDEFPVMNNLTGALHFSSTGHIGMGGFDIFTTTGEKENWTKPENLKYPINTSRDDFYMNMMSETEGYLSSNRLGGKGSDDIYRFTTPPPVKSIVLRAKVINGRTREPLEQVEVRLHDIAKDTQVLKLTDTMGLAYYSLVCDKDYNIEAVKNFLRSSQNNVRNYDRATSDTVNFQTTNCGDKDTIDVLLTLFRPIDTPVVVKPKFKVGDVFVLKDLYYDLDKYNIRPDAAKVLDSLVLILKKYPSLVIELSSHTDCRASDAYNQRLSQNRATSAVKYLVSRGINARRLVAKGYGETRLTNECKDGVKCSEEQHQQNRRTEVRVLRFNEKDSQ